MTPLEAKRTTPADFNFRVEALKLSEIDKMYLIHRQAWATQQIKATKKSGKPYFKRFKDFYDFEKEIAKAQGDIQEYYTPHKVSMAKGNSRINEYMMKITSQEGG